MMNSTHIRRFILLTRSHAERDDRVHYTPHFVVSKIRGLFSCDEVVVSKETHSSGGYHFHVGILNSTASRYTATKMLRDNFVEFEGRQLNVSFHKCWNTILKYCLKQDNNPFCWGTTVNKCRERIGLKGCAVVMGSSTSNSSKKTSLNKKNLLDKLLSYTDWTEVLKDRELRSLIAPKISSYKQTFMEYHNAVKDNPAPFVERLNMRVAQLVQAEPHIFAYSKEELGENVWLMLCWIAENFALERKLHQQQLFIYGETSVGKTLLFKLLEEADVCNFYAMDELLEFSDASNKVDAFIFDEFSLDMSNLGSTIRLLNKIADGQKVKLNVKYSFFLKTRNVGVVRISNDYPHFPASRKLSAGVFKAFKGRFTILEFDRRVNWEVGRLLVTLKELVDSLLCKRLAASAPSEIEK